MKKNILWILAALMLTMVAVSCSSDDDDDCTCTSDEDRTMFIKHGKVHYRGSVLNYEPVDVKNLPEWLLKAYPDIEGDEIGQILCKRIWKGKLTYLYNSLWMSYYPGASYFEDGTLAKIDWKEFEEAGGWEAWTCIYFKPIIPD